MAKNTFNPNLSVILKGSTLTMQEFADEVFANLSVGLKRNLLKSPRYYPELSIEDWEGKKVYYFRIRRESVLGENVPFKTMDKNRRDEYLYGITKEDVDKDRERLGKYRDVECTLNSTMVVYKHGYDYGIQETPLKDSPLVKVKYESYIVQVYFHPVKLTKKNAKTLAGYIK